METEHIDPQKNSFHENQASLWILAIVYMVLVVLYLWKLLPNYDDSWKWPQSTQVSNQ